MISLLAIIWVHLDTKDVTKVADLAISTIWFVIPTFPFFIALPIFLKNGLQFYASLAFSTAIMLLSYIIMVMILKNFGYKL